MKDLILGLLIGGIIGLGAGVNLGKDKPILSNPFAEKTSMTDFNKRFEEFQDDVSKKSKKIYEDSKKTVNETFE